MQNQPQESGQLSGNMNLCLLLQISSQTGDFVVLWDMVMLRTHSRGKGGGQEMGAHLLRYLVMPGQPQGYTWPWWCKKKEKS